MAQYEVETSEETGRIQNNNHGKKTRWQHDYVDMSNFVIENLVSTNDSMRLLYSISTRTNIQLKLEYIH